MPKPRKQLISLTATPYYHCTSRCVRRAFLCGFDEVTQTSFEHRRPWVENRILELAEIFSIDVCAYAVMHNHYHVVLHINAERIKTWSDLKVCEQWLRLYKGSHLSQRFVQGFVLTAEEKELLAQDVQGYREQLIDISWFMRALNEPIARQANAEDRCSGKFWGSRFYSQALLDEKALLACLAYVDLNPVRAKISSKPETSQHTSIKQRIDASIQGKKQPTGMRRFVGNSQKTMLDGLPFSLPDYLTLVDWTSRKINKRKRDLINDTRPPILERLHITEKSWQILTTQFEQQFSHFIGSPCILKTVMQKLNYQRTPNIKRCMMLLQ